MNIPILPFFSQNLSQIQAGFFNRVDTRQKQIFLIASAAIALFVLCLVVVWRCRQSEKKVETISTKQGQEIVPPIVTDVIKNKEPADDKKTVAVQEQRQGDLQGHSQADTPVKILDEAANLPTQKSADVEKEIHTEENQPEPIKSEELTNEEPENDIPSEDPLILEEQPTDLSESNLEPLIMMNCFRGKVRENKDFEKAPEFPAVFSMHEVTTIYDEQLWTLAFAACFHTEESHQEIHAYC